jgi:hypothetical protein
MTTPQQFQQALSSGDVTIIREGSLSAFTIDLTTLLQAVQRGDQAAAQAASIVEHDVRSISLVHNKGPRPIVQKQPASAATGLTGKIEFKRCGKHQGRWWREYRICPSRLCCRCRKRQQFALKQGRIAAPADDHPSKRGRGVLTTWRVHTGII